MTLPKKAFAFFFLFSARVEKCQKMPSLKIGTKKGANMCPQIQGMEGRFLLTFSKCFGIITVPLNIIGCKIDNKIKLF